MRIIAIHNQKGGTGKTTTTISLGDAFARRGYRVLILDVDSQGHIRKIFGVKHRYTMYDILIEDVLVSECIVNVRKNLDCVFSDPTLGGAELILSNQNPQGRERLLSARMGLVNNYDFILIDCSPSLNLINQLALVYAQELLIPINMDYLGLVGAIQVIDNLDMLEKELNNHTKITGIIPTFVDYRTNMTHQVIKTIQETYGNKVLPNIRIDTKIQQAIAQHKTIYEYDPQSRGAQDYDKLSKVLLNGRNSRRRRTQTK